MKGPKYVKDFDFSAKPCNYSHGGDVKMASGGYYNKGGSCDTVKMASGGYYSKGGKAKASAAAPRLAGVKAAKVGKVMGEYKAGTLHSGSKKGPAVTSRKQAVAIALSEGRKAAKKA